MSLKNNALKKALVRAIIVYRILISPSLPSQCRFYPTCSQYAIDALNKYGAIRGVLKIIRRIVCCQPFHPGGFDPA